MVATGLLTRPGLSAYEALVRGAVLDSSGVEAVKSHSRFQCDLGSERERSLDGTELAGHSGRKRQKDGVNSDG